MAKVRLQRARVGALVRQDKAGCTLEAILASMLNALDQLGQARDACLAKRK